MVGKEISQSMHHSVYFSETLAQSQFGGLLLLTQLKHFSNVEQLKHFGEQSNSIKFCLSYFDNLQSLYHYTSIQDMNSRLLDLYRLYR
jgi:hypothetical protein